jgi:hypothetical protein
MSKPSDAQLRRLFMLYDEIGVTDRAERLAHMRRVLEDDSIGSTTELSETRVSTLIAALESAPERLFISAAEAKAQKRTNLFKALGGRSTTQETIDQAEGR